MLATRASRAGAAVLSLAVVLLGAPSVATAQEADRAMARDLAQQGEAALDAKQFDKAADLFRRAHALVAAPTLLLQLARAQVGMGRLVIAEGTLNRILREGAAPGAPPAYKAAVETAAKELAELSPRIPTVVIQVTGTANPTVTLDDERVPLAALGGRRPVDPGRHVARARADGFAPAEATFAIAERGSETVNLKLVPGSGAPAGAHAGQEPAGSGSPLRTLGFISVGVGGASLIAGAISGGIAIGKHDSAAKTCAAAAASCDADRSSYLSVAAVSTGTFIAGGILAAGGVVLIVAAPKAQTSTSVAATFGPNYAGIRGVF